jgi:hypothetical protein
VDLGRHDETRGSPDLTTNRAGDPGARSVTRRARATSSKSARLAFTRTLRPATCLVHASGTRRTRVVACRSWLAGPRCGNASTRPTQPASVGAGEQRGESPTRVRGSVARRVCPRVVSGCRSRQATPRPREACHPLATGRVDGGPARADSKESARVKRRREPVSRWPNRDAGEVRSRALERASRGEGPCSMEGIPDRHSSAHRSRGRAGDGLGGLHGCAGSRERQATREGGDRDVRGSVRTHRDGNKTPTAMPLRRKGDVRPAEANRTDVRQAIPPIAQARKRRTHREPTRRGYWYET